MENFVIALPSLNHLALTGQNPGEFDQDQEGTKYVLAPNLEISTLIKLERCIAWAGEDRFNLRNSNPWDVIGRALEEAGFVSIARAKVPDDTLTFFYPKPWDEAWAGSNEFSFFVTFPSSAPHELVASLILATSYPSFFCSVAPDFSGPEHVLLISADHEAIYPDDLGYRDAESDDQIHIGCVVLPEDQFTSPQAFERAHASLLRSGYLVF